MKRYICIAGLVLLSAAVGFSIRSEYVYRLGKKDGQAEQMKSLAELATKMHSISLPIGTNWFHIRFDSTIPRDTNRIIFEAVHGALSVTESSNMFNHIKEFRERERAERFMKEIEQ